MWQECLKISKGRRKEIVTEPRPPCYRAAPQVFVHRSFLPLLLWTACIAVINCYLSALAENHNDKLDFLRCNVCQTPKEANNDRILRETGPHAPACDCDQVLRSNQIIVQILTRIVTHVIKSIHCFYACYKKYPLFDNLPARMWLWWVSIRTFNHVQPRKIFWNHGVLINDHHDEIGQNTWKWKWDNITSLSISLLNWSIWNCLSLGLIYTYISLTFVQPDKVVHCSQFWV